MESLQKRVYSTLKPNEVFVYTIRLANEDEVSRRKVHFLHNKSVNVEFPTVIHSTKDYLVHSAAEVTKVRFNLFIILPQLQDEHIKLYIHQIQNRIMSISLLEGVLY